MIESFLLLSGFFWSSSFLTLRSCSCLLSFITRRRLRLGCGASGGEIAAAFGAAGGLALDSCLLDFVDLFDVRELMRGRLFGLGPVAVSLPANAFVASASSSPRGG